MKLRLIWAALLSASAALFLLAGSATAHSKLDYVALGDSYAAAPGITAPVTENTPASCGQSSLNYPHLLAGWVAKLRFRVDLTDVSCTSAETKDMTQPQTIGNDVIPPQFDALSRDTDLVTVTIGGNDIEFVSIVVTCMASSNTGTPCQDLYVQGDVDLLRDRIDAVAPRIDAVLDGIRLRSPRARVVLTGYPDILPGDGTLCWPQMPYTASDVLYMYGVQNYFNAMLRREARRNGAGFGDSHRASVGRDACRTPEVRYVEPLQPVNPAFPVHPNAKGAEAMARATLVGLLY